ncbi:hypothetical protein DTL00_18830 [Sphingomonas melonis]
MRHGSLLGGNLCLRRVNSQCKSTGGWHYDTGRFVRAIGFYLTDEAAIAAVRRANRLFERLQRHRRSVDSVLYEGGRYRAFSFTGLPPARFPAERPRYQ